MMSHLKRQRYRGSRGLTAKAAPLFPFVVSRESGRGFSQTVENLFDLSFAVKSDRVRMKIDEGKPVVEWAAAASEREDEGAEGEDASEMKPKQSIVTLDYHTWKALSRAQETKETDFCIPTRLPSTVSDTSASAAASISESASARQCASL